MRCPACTTTVEDFKTLHLTPDPKGVAAAASPAAKAAKVAARQAAGSIEDDGKPVLLRFDNASWVRAPAVLSLHSLSLRGVLAQAHASCPGLAPPHYNEQPKTTAN